MLENDDIRWLRSTANDLNNLLQVIAESSKALQPLCANDTEALRYYSFLSKGLDRAQTVTAQMAAKLGGATDVMDKVQAKTVAPTPAAKPAEVSIQNPDGTKELIMMIDDEQIVLDLAAAVLTTEGYRVIAMTDVFKSLATYERMKNEISLVILDFTMPIMDGSEVFEEIQKLNRGATVMLSSGFAEHQEIRTMLAKGLKGFLPKPYTKDKLLSQIRSTLDTVRSSRTGERRVL